MADRWRGVFVPAAAWTHDGNLTLYRSTDGGTSWAAAATVHADCSGYSAMVALGAEGSEEGRRQRVGVVWSSAGLPRGGPVFYRNVSVP